MMVAGFRALQFPYPVWTHVAVSVRRDGEGVPIHLIGQIESLEARRRAEAKVAEERERFKITLQVIDDAVITTDAQTHITHINAAAGSLLDVYTKAVEGRRFVDSTGLVNGLVIVLRDVTLDVDRTRDLQHRAMHDPLTGLSNRAEFEQRLRAMYGKARHLDKPAAVIAIDLDRFKAVNDAAGHAAGDAALCKVAAACRLAARSSDVVARLGGDEFAIILENCAEDRTKFISQELLRALNLLEIEWGGSREKSWLEAADKAC